VSVHDVLGTNRGESREIKRGGDLNQCAPPAIWRLLSSPTQFKGAYASSCHKIFIDNLGSNSSCSG
jgi:hypothetical protein